MRILVLFLFLGLHSFSVVRANLDAPDGWRFPNKADYEGDWELFKKWDPEPFHIRGDFDGNEIVDDAWILINKRTKGWGLFAFLRMDKNGKDGEIFELDSKLDGYPQRMGLKIAKPGKYTTACGKGIWECEDDEPKEVVISNASIDFFIYESAGSLFFWDKKQSKFIRVWTSD